jgi:Putative peptidoglycan binding domain/L,D-transpeptidase catalytic domain
VRLPGANDSERSTATRGRRRWAAATVSAVACAAAVTANLPAPAAAVTGLSTGTAVVAHARHAGFSMKDPFAREVTRFGDADVSPYSIDHVMELQYRLRWAGFFHAGVTGLFAKLTRHAVKMFQRSVRLRVTGVANHKTWARLIHHTIRHRGAIPHLCKRAGWHACYDRSMHQVTLWHGGRMRNAWLVRGGERDLQTRVGNWHVYWRDINHVSSVYDTPMPYSQFFNGGQALHGSAYMVDPFYEHSHGCVNMYIEDARQLWRLTSKHRLGVSVYGAWD